MKINKDWQAKKKGQARQFVMEEHLVQNIWFDLI